MKRLLKWGILLTVVSIVSIVSMPNFCLAQNSDAYRLQGNAILVDRASLWGNWIYQNDLVTNLNVPVREADIFQVGTDGLRPVFFRRNINVGPTARDFTYPDLVARCRCAN